LVVVHRGQVVGTWQTDGSKLGIALFAESGPVPAAGLESEAARVRELAGADLTMAVRPE
jgi:hypothetical protein